MRIGIGCDHNGVVLKKTILELLAQQGHQVEDFGTHTADSVDYPDIAKEVAQAVARCACDRGILICGTGIGMSITANKVPGVRAAVCHDVFLARRAREHNDANVLCLGGSTLGPALAQEIVRTYLETSFEGGRHARRVGKISALEQSVCKEH